MKPVDELLWRRWDEVDRLLDGLLDQSADERLVELARLADTDPALHALVTRLLARVNENDERVSGPSDAAVAGAFGEAERGLDEPDLEPGTQVGRYVVGARRGRGGMATVYEAGRSDGAYQQRVALKVLRRGLDTDDMVRRFLAERQILSSFTHPGIARLLDGGSLPDGRPYLVMELVEGRPITAFADERRLDVIGRLDLFLAVAGAVHAAHRQLVVHRDLKPSNILVDDDGHVKLLDFGIAKLLEGDSSATDVGARLLTPEYASPEQMQGGPITTATDVYQLGLLLRELLTGLPPSIGDTGSGRPPILPSRATTLDVDGRPDAAARAAARGITPTKLSKELAGDLDVIVAKALREEPEDRYASAAEMAADVRRRLRGLPIIAHPESTMYRLRKFAGRRPLVLPGAAVLAVGLVAFVAALVVQNDRITRERDVARAATETAQATETFLVDLLRSPDPFASESSRDLTVVEALQRGRARIGAELADQPEVRAALLESMGQAFSGLGRKDVADTLIREALEVWNGLGEGRDVRIADLINALGDNSRLGRDMKAADSLYRVELRVRAAAGSVADTTWSRIAAALSDTRLALGDLDSALVLAEQATDVLTRAGDTASHRFTRALGALGPALRGAEQFDSAAVVYQRILDRQLRQPVPSPSDIATTHNNLGYLLRVMKDYPGAEQHYRAALEQLGKVVEEGHPMALMFSSNLATALEFQGRYSEVVDLGKRRIEAAKRYWPEGNWQVGAAYSALGRFLMRQDRPADAVAPLRGAFGSYVATLGLDHGWTATAQGDLGVALWLSGNRVEAVSMLDRAYETFQAFPNGPNPVGLAMIDSYVKALRKSGNRRQADRFASLLPSADVGVSPPTGR